MPPSPILRTLRLTREVAGEPIVDDVTVTVRAGSVLVVTGPSGSGKTSFLRLLNRLDEPTSGTVEFEGRDYRELSPRELRRRIGMVTQTAYLFPGSIAENLRFGPLQRGLDLAQNAVEELLNQVGLAERRNENVSHLSGGEAQRVSVARALANQPAVLLLDEPTSALDADAKDDVEKLILSVVRRNELTCVMVSHDLAQAARVADEVMIMRKGKVARFGAAREVINAEGFLC